MQNRQKDGALVPVSFYRCFLAIELSKKSWIVAVNKDGRLLLSKTAVSQLGERLWEDYQAFAQRDLSLGIEASPSFVREPQGNGVAESSSPGTITKPGSSPATEIVPQPRYEPLKASLIRTQRPI